MNGGNHREGVEVGRSHGTSLRLVSVICLVPLRASVTSGRPARYGSVILNGRIVSMSVTRLVFSRVP